MMEEIIDHKEVKSQENIKTAVLNALNFAVRKNGENTALVNMGEVPVNQEEIAAMLPDYYHCVSVEDILTRKAKQPSPEKRGLVVTGYSRDYYQDIKQEEEIEWYVRTNTNQMNSLRRGDFRLLVLSDSMPFYAVFKGGGYSTAWHNGPFLQGCKNVWSIRNLPDGNSIELVQHDNKLEGPMDRNEKRTWIDIDKIAFNAAGRAYPRFTETQ